MFFPLICTHTDVLAASASSLLCSWSISLGAVFRAWGQWEQTRGEEGGGWLHLPGDLLQGPHCGLARFSCLSSKAQPRGGRERDEGRQFIDSGAAIVICVP